MRERRQPRPPAVAQLEPRNDDSGDFFEAGGVRDESVVGPARLPTHKVKKLAVQIRASLGCEDPGAAESVVKERSLLGAVDQRAQVLLPRLGSRPPFAR